MAVRKLTALITVLLLPAFATANPQANIHLADGASARIAVDIPAGDLADALKALAKQTGTDLVYRPEQVRGFKTSRLKGELTARDAVAELLKGTNLRASINATTGAMLITEPKPIASSSSSTGTEVDLALADRAMQRVASSSGKDDEKGASDERRPGAEGVAAGDEPSAGKGIPEILVTGSRSLNMDIRRTEDDPQPYVVFEREEILRSQAINIEEFIRTRLPMNTIPVNRTTGDAVNRSNINLRGLGTNQTLILVDGRRLAQAGASGFPTQPDLNGISLAMVERIEVLPSTAGGIYGGSATGGVVNVILRRDLDTMEAGINYANTFDTDASDRRLDVSAGFNFEGGKTRLMMSASHSEANEMVVGDRDFAARAIALTLKNNPGLVSGLATPPLGATVNIRSVNGAPLQLDAIYGSTLLSSNRTHLPYGYRGVTSDSGAALVANSGSYNTDLPEGLQGLGRGARAAPTQESLAANLRREFGSRLEAFVDVANFTNKALSNAGAITNSVVLPGIAPNNPFAQDIRVRFPSPQVSAENRMKLVQLRATGGLIARLPHDWMVETEYTWNRSRYRHAGSVNNVLDSAGNGALSSGLPGTNNRPALNVLQEQNVFPLDYSPYLLPIPNQFIGPTDSINTNATLRFSGPVFRLPGGPLVFSALVERRMEEIEDSVNQGISIATRAATYSFLPHRSQDVDSFYAEVRAPLISAGNALPLVRELELQLSMRQDRYRTSSTVNGGRSIPSPDAPAPVFDYSVNEMRSSDQTVGLRYQPIQDVTLRASYGTGFLPPSVTQIAPRLIFSGPLTFGFRDPRRGDNDLGDVSFNLYDEGNPNLKPESSRSWSTGLVFTPRFLPDLRLSVDYTRIDKIDEIQSNGNWQFYLDNELVLPGHVIRGPNLSTDEAGWAGPVTDLYANLINIAETSVEAYDIQANYAQKLSDAHTLNWYAVATHTPHYENRLLPDLPVIDKAGYVDGPARWQGNIGVDWEHDNWTVGWNMQYYGSFELIYPDPEPGSIAADDLRSQGGDATIRRQMYHDLIGTYRLSGAGLLANTVLSAGIQNLFNTSAPIIAATSASWGTAGQGDPRLRRYSISLRKTF